MDFGLPLHVIAFAEGDGQPGDIRMAISIRAPELRPIVGGKGYGLAESEKGEEIGMGEN